MKTNKRRVLHLLSSNKFSGAENVACTIISNDSNECFYCSKEGPIRNTLKEKNITFIPIKRLSVIDINKIIIEYKIDIVHAHDFQASFCAGLCQNKNVKVISHIHCNPDFIKKWNMFSIAYKVISKKFHRIIVVSKETLNGTVFTKYIEDKTIVLDNVVDSKLVLNNSKKFKTEKYDLVFLARLTDLKQPLFYLDIINDLKEKNIKACLIGDGDLYKDCEEKIKKCNLEKNVSLLGFQSNPFPYVLNSKLAIMPSKFEGLPMSAIECMILGVPVINSGVGGLTNLFINHEDFICHSKEEYINCIINNLNRNKKDLKNECDDIIKKYIDIEGYIINLNKIYNGEL